MERGRRVVRDWIPKAASPRQSPPAAPGAALPWTGRSMAAPVAGRTDGTADLRSHRQTRGLSGLRGLPRSRRADPARGVAPKRIFQRSAVTAAAFGRCRGSDARGDSPAAICPVFPLSHPLPLELPASIAVETSHQTDLETPVETSNEMLKNVLPFRPLSEPKSPALTPVENSAFNELARQLAARLEDENGAAVSPDMSDIDDSVVAPAIATETTEPPVEAAQWLAQPEPPRARPDPARQGAVRPLPVGVLIYRLDRLLYANQPSWSGSATTACAPSKRPAASTRSTSNPASPMPAAPPIPARR